MSSGELSVNTNNQTVGALQGNTLTSAGGALNRAIGVLKPRDSAAIMRTLKTEIALIGEDAIYAWEVNDRKKGKVLIEGVSIDGAYSMARAFGNCSVELSPVQETKDGIVLTATFIDFEANVSLPRQFLVSMDKSLGGRMDDDAARKRDIVFQIGQSKAIRNTIVSALPAYLEKLVIETAKGAVRKSIEDSINKHGIEKVVAVAVSKLGKMGVSEPMLLAKISLADRKAITIDELVVLYVDLRSLESGRESVGTLYPSKTADESTPERKEPETLSDLDDGDDEGAEQGE